MKKLFLTLIITIGVAIGMIKAQNLPTTPDPQTTPAQTDQDIDPAGKEPENIQFPPDIVDTTITDTTDIPATRVDSSGRMEGKDSIMNNRKMRLKEDKRKKK